MAKPHSSMGVPEGQAMMADVVEGLADTMVATGAGPSMPGDHGQKRQAGSVGLRYEPPGKTKDRTSSAHAAPARNERIAMDWRILDDLNSPGRGVAFVSDFGFQEDGLRATYKQATTTIMTVNCAHDK
jgi:hypothetical protein